MISIIDSQRGWTALIYATQSGRVDCVRLLLGAGADKDAKDEVRVSCESLLLRVFFALSIIPIFFFSWGSLDLSLYSNFHFVSLTCYFYLVRGCS